MIPLKPRILNKILTPRALCSETPKTVVGWQAHVVIGITLHNQRYSIRRALQSALGQDIEKSLAIIILDDHSDDDWEKEVSDLLCDPKIIVIKGHCGTPARARNALLDFVDEQMPNCHWVARLDADDCLAAPDSIAEAVKAGEQRNAKFVVGSNALVLNGERLSDVNFADAETLLDSKRLQSFIERMVQGDTVHELPSCNLVLQSRTGFRYPNINSAEDHWLLAQLLFMHRKHAAVMRTPLYAEYTLNGSSTVENRQTNRWKSSRLRLAETTATWSVLQDSDADILGYGMEGVVERQGDWVRKTFCMRTLSDERVHELQKLLQGTAPYIPEPTWYMNEMKQWVCEYPWFASSPVGKKLPKDVITRFLKCCIEREVIPRNIKRTNFRLTVSGELCYIDIGSDIRSYTASGFRDIAARTYCQFCLGWADEELTRRSSYEREEDVLGMIPGFKAFYANLLKHVFAMNIGWRVDQVYTQSYGTRNTFNPNVTLMVKTCAMDADVLEYQCKHLVSHLSVPQAFAEVILLIDPYSGPYLRAHTPANPKKMYSVAEQLSTERIVDRVLVAPTDSETVSKHYMRWFNVSSDVTHTTTNAPLFPQLWGFEQVKTRYLLQCDTDVLIGRRDWSHDYLDDMVRALQPKDVLGVAFNIPHPEDSEPNPYIANQGEYVPEVRCGLLDLKRMWACMPIDNPIKDGRLSLTWHRALEQHQKIKGLRTLRGGDPRTFYVHPLNSDKHDHAHLMRIQDLIAQGRVPAKQLGQWDLQVDKEGGWNYPHRHEEVIFLMKGRDTPIEKLERCFGSLRAQCDQSFGVIVIDDGGCQLINAQYRSLLGSLWDRTTLIRRPMPFGRIPNFLDAINNICLSLDSLIVVLDLDDMLVSKSVLSELKLYRKKGHDLIQGAMYRPDKPLKIYQPDYTNPRSRWGDDTWTHLRAFTKRLFNSIPIDYFQHNGEWINECTDWATMVPMAEMAQSPIYVEKYFYWHERSNAYSKEKRQRLDGIIAQIIGKTSLRQN